MPFKLDTVSILEQTILYAVSAQSARAKARVQRSASVWARHTLRALMDDCRTVESVSSEDDPETFAAAVAGELAAFEVGQRAKAVVDQHQLEALARMHATMTAELEARQTQHGVSSTPLSAHEAVVMEVTTATGLSDVDVSLRLELAIAPASRAGYLREQVASGGTTLLRATQILDATRHLDDDAADDVARTTLAQTRDGAGLGASLFRQRLRRAVVAADADHAARRRRARDRIGAHAQVHDDGTGTLTIVNDAEKVVAALDRADAAARAARAAGDPRALTELRADFLTGAAMFAGAPDLVTAPSEGGTKGRLNARRPSHDVPPTGSPDLVPGLIRTSDGAPHVSRAGAPMGDSAPYGEAAAAAFGGRHAAHRGPGSDSGFWRRPPATVWIVVPFSTATGLDDRPCELPGHGWVSAAHAREIMTAEGSVWHTLFVDEPTGEAVRLSHPGYRPTAEMIRHVRAVDGVCRGPGCAVPAHLCDLDHDIPAPHGATSTHNLTAKHRRHHRIRTAGVWSADRDPDDGTVTWTTAAGRTYTTHPKDWLEHHRSPEPHDKPPGAPPPPLASDEPPY